jgi:hypothetical protein
MALPTNEIFPKDITVRIHKMDGWQLIERMTGWKMFGKDTLEPYTTLDVFCRHLSEELKAELEWKKCDFTVCD